MGEPTTADIPLREAFAAPEGRRLIIADYSQLELRVVAHLADCTSMVEVLSSGGDIHSRTAYKMFEEVRSAVDSGKVAVDATPEISATSSSSSSPSSSSSSGCSSCGLPLVKDEFPGFRTRAKVLNFSLLYGKTAYALAQEWKISGSEAKAVINKWYDTFPEIREWKLGVKSKAASGRWERTIMGRKRPIVNMKKGATGDVAAALRQAVNSPVQGSAADIMALAMVKLMRSEVLERLKYRQILQIHDEIVLEGPEEHAEEALAEVVRVMEDPLPFALRVPLKVDARHARTWLEGKL